MSIFPRLLKMQRKGRLAIVGNGLNKVDFTKVNVDYTSGGIPGMGGGPVPTQNAPGTLLYDAVYLSAHDMLSKEVGRKAMILLTDGQDEGSRLKLRDATEAAQKADAIVYVLLCADRGFYGGIGYSGEGDMRKLTEQTGGRVINVGNKFDKLREAFDQIAAELRSQYNIGYVPRISNSMAPAANSKSEQANYKIKPAPDTTPNNDDTQTLGKPASPALRFPS
jgi:VWFA-related protein